MWGLSQALQQNIIAGLPGRMVEAYSIEEFRSAIAEYENVAWLNTLKTLKTLETLKAL